MDNKHLLNILYKISFNYINGNKSKSWAENELIERIYIKDILDSNDIFLINWYYAIKYLNDEYETTDREIKYYIECYEGKKTFSKDKRDDVIING